MPNYRNPNKGLAEMIRDFKGLLHCQIDEADELLKDPESLKNNMYKMHDLAAKLKTADRKEFIDDIRNNFTCVEGVGRFIEIQEFLEKMETVTGKYKKKLPKKRCKMIYFVDVGCMKECFKKLSEQQEYTTELVVVCDDLDKTTAIVNLKSVVVGGIDPETTSIVENLFPDVHIDFKIDPDDVRLYILESELDYLLQHLRPHKDMKSLDLNISSDEKTMPYKLTSEQEDFFRDLIYKKANFFGRDKLFYLIKTKHPEMGISRRMLWSFMDRQEVFQLNRRPTMKRGLVKPITSQKPGHIQMDNLYVQHPFNGYKYICHAVDTFNKKDDGKPVKSLDVESMKQAIDTFLS
ncbi:hypothetical protein HK097_002208 [Rhizophlyctis rosea]|uniref:Uncharacterized protein n=1 Tax=Rhizophlyctis rosea TaxID=64517 RepID=A0AAD5SIM6_9FUNG|nr:hypothetical protein HK097_002208 [Rhizophlyctis rosea]